MNIGAFKRQQLPFAPVRVSKGEGGERIIEGVFSFVDLHPDIPWGRKVGEVWVVYSKSERADLIEAKIRRQERAEKRAAKGLLPIKVKAPKVREEKPAIPVQASVSQLQTVKRGGKFVQVGSDNLTAHIIKQ